MKKIYFLLLGLIFVFAYVGIISYVRVSNKEEMTYNFYQDWRKNYIVTENKRSAYVNTTPHTSKAVSLSEAQGYGMVITILANRRSWASHNQFKQLYNYYLKHREVINGKQTQLMSWRQVHTQSQIRTQKSSATDGDLLIARALLLANTEYPNNNYDKQAKKLLNDILKYEYNSENKTLIVGNWATKSSKYYNLLRTSDVMPDSFEDFYKFSGNKLWLNINNSMLNYLITLSQQHTSGLIPDFAWINKKGAFPVKPNTIASKYDGDYWMNACRIPLMLAYNKDNRSKKIVQKLLNFFTEKSTVTSGYTLNGKNLNNYESASFSMPIFLATYANRNQGYDKLFLSQQYVFFQQLSQTNYYDATLTTLAALVAK